MANFSPPQALVVPSLQDPGALPLGQWFSQALSLVLSSSWLKALSELAPPGPAVVSDPASQALWLGQSPKAAAAVAAPSGRNRTGSPDGPVNVTRVAPRKMPHQAPANAPSKATALTGVDAATYVDGLVQEALTHPAVRHPYLQDLAQGRVPDLWLAVQDFAQQYYGYSSHFPRFLTALISRLEQPRHRAALVANLTEEAGQYTAADLAELTDLGIDPVWIEGIPHPELFQRFRQAMGVGHSGEEGLDLEVVCWREQLLALLSGCSAAEAVGALGLGTETIVPMIYAPFVAAVETLGLPPRERVFFLLHTAVDDHHQATLREIAIDCAATAQGRIDLAKGMRKALALRHAFWSWLHQRALQSSAS